MNEPVRRSSAPWSFRLAKLLIRSGLPGGYRVLDIARRRGWLNCLVRFRIGDGVDIDVPLYRPENLWDRRDVLDYDPPLIDDLVQTAARFPAPRVLIDCGADIGTVSVLVAARDPGLARLVAFEPNAEAFSILKSNIERLPMAGEARQAGVGATAGRGTLRSPAHDRTAHAMFMAPTPDGDIEITCIDDLTIDPNGSVILKVDVEGGELDVLTGAVETLRGARAFAVSFEAQIDQAERTGIEPMEILRFLCAIRPCRYHVSDLPGLTLDPDQPFFTQIERPQAFGYNILCYTDPDASDGSAPRTAVRSTGQ